MPTDYVFRTAPLAHQLETFLKTRSDRNYAIFWEMGTGKSHLTINTAAYLFRQDKIDAALIVAPKGVHANWDAPREGIQAHLPEDILEKARRLIWFSHEAKLKRTERAFAELVAHKPGSMAWLMMPYDALITKPGYAAAEKFLRTHRTLMVLDESARIKTVTANRTRAAELLGTMAHYRRILTGTPVAQRPFDVYAQLRWLDKNFWVRNGFGSFTSFRHYFGAWEQRKNALGQRYEVQSTDRRGQPIYYHLDELAGLLATISSRVLKDDVLDLPPKTYQRAYYDLVPSQRKLYDALEKDMIAWFLEHSEPVEGEERRTLTVSADLAITRQLRLQQIAMGYVLADEEADPHAAAAVCAPNPAAELLAELTEDMSHQAIVWCRFRRDIEEVGKVLGDRATFYHGGVDDAGRARALAAFKSGDKQFFVATQSTAGEGLTLTEAQAAIYYSNSRKLSERLQSEDRCHRIGQSKPVLYIDLVARGTISEVILDALERGEEIAAAAMGDALVKRRKNCL